MGGLTRRQMLGAPLLAASPGASPAVLDSHVHVWTRDPRFPFSKASTTPPPDRDATPETLLALMKAHGVKKSVLVQVSHHGWDHSYLSDVLRRYPDAFIGMARVNPEDPAAPDQLAALVRDHAFRGLRLNVQPDKAYDWIKGPLMPALWRRCEELKIPLGLQTKGPRLPDLLPLIERFPGLTLIVDHMADIALDDEPGFERLLSLARMPRVYVKISHTWLVSKQPFPYVDSLARVKRVYDRFGPKRLLYASDWPGVDKFCGYGGAIGLVRDEMKFLNADDRAWIFARTANKIWRPFSRDRQRG